MVANRTAHHSPAALPTSAAILLGAPEFLDRFLPLDSGLIDIHNPPEAVVLALAGTLSTRYAAAAGLVNFI